MVFLVASYYNTSSIGGIADRIDFDILMGCMSEPKLEQSEQVGLVEYNLVEYFAVDSMDTDSDTGIDIDFDLCSYIDLYENSGHYLYVGFDIGDIDSGLSKHTCFL